MDNATSDCERVITLGGRPRTARFDFNALVLAEEKTGRNLMTVQGWGFTHPNPRADDPEPRRLTSADYRAILWAMLVHEDPALTLEEVGHWMEGPKTNEIQNLIWSLYFSEYAPVPETARPTESDGANGGPSRVLTSASAMPSSGDSAL